MSEVKHTPGTMYFIASLKHTHHGHEHIVWWQKDHCGYTPVLGDYVGEYAFPEAVELNDGIDFIAVPVDVVHELESPEPYTESGRRFYDQRGPVVDNRRSNWAALHACSVKMPGRALVKIKPECFRGKRRSFALTEVEVQQ